MLYIYHMKPSHIAAPSTFQRFHEHRRPGVHGFQVTLAELQDALETLMQDIHAPLGEDAVEKWRRHG